jgi:hypothetical protein
LSILNLRFPLHRLGLSLSVQEAIAMTPPYVFAVIAALATLVVTSLAMLVLF